MWTQYLFYMVFRLSSFYSYISFRFDDVGLSWPAAIALDAVSADNVAVYWTERTGAPNYESSIRRKRTNIAPEVLVQESFEYYPRANEMRFLGVDVDAASDQLYWSLSGPDTSGIIFRATTDGSQVEELVADLSSPTALTIALMLPGKSLAHFPMETAEST